MRGELPFRPWTVIGFFLGGGYCILLLLQYCTALCKNVWCRGQARKTGFEGILVGQSSPATQPSQSATHEGAGPDCDPLEMDEGFEFFLWLHDASGAETGRSRWRGFIWKLWSWLWRKRNLELEHLNEKEFQKLLLHQRIQILRRISGWWHRYSGEFLDGLHVALWLRIDSEEARRKNGREEGVKDVDTHPRGIANKFSSVISGWDDDTDYCISYAKGSSSCISISSRTGWRHDLLVRVTTLFGYNRVRINVQVHLNPLILKQSWLGPNDYGNFTIDQAMKNGVLVMSISRV